MPVTQRTPLPHNLPTKTRCIQLEIPDSDEYQTLFMSVVGALSYWTTYDREITHKAALVADLWKKVILTIRDCQQSKDNFVALEDDMPFFREICDPDGSCHLEFQCCPGEWIRLANIDQINQAGSPSAGTPQPAPGGGAITNCFPLRANSILSLGVPVSTGDAITLQVSGSGWDGGEFDFGPLWRCPDGKQFIAGKCTGFQRTDSGDPVPSAYHMSTIISINGTFYSIMPDTPFTVPSGVSNVTPFIQVNDSDITNNQGDYQVCATIVNNQAAAWSYTFDLSLLTGGWETECVFGGSSIPGQWVAGVGFQATDNTCGGAPNRSAVIHLTTPIPQLTEVDVNFDLTPGTFSVSAPEFIVLVNGTVELERDSPYYSAGNHTEFVLASISSVTDIRVVIQSDADPTFTGSGTIKSITLKGTGVNPFV